MANRARSSIGALAVVLALALAGCAGGLSVPSGSDPLASTSSLSQLPPAVGPRDCIPPSATAIVHRGTEVTGQDGPGAAFWALFPGRPPFPPGVDLRVRFAVNGGHGMRIFLGGPGGQEIRLDHVYPDFGADWGRPGDIWAAMVNFPVPGCWRISADRADKHADFWVLVK